MKSQRLRLRLSAALALFMTAAGCFGLVFLAIRPLQVLCAVLALLGSLCFQLIRKNLKKQSAAKPAKNGGKEKTTG